MNIIEAIKSGKRFRRKSWTGRDYIEANVASLDLRIDALVAEDWEVEEAPVLVDAKKFNAAWKRAMKEAGATDITYGNFESFRDLVAKELGL